MHHLREAIVEFVRRFQSLEPVEDLGVVHSSVPHVVYGIVDGSRDLARYLPPSVSAEKLNFLLGVESFGVQYRTAELLFFRSGEPAIDVFEDRSDVLARHIHNVAGHFPGHAVHLSDDGVDGLVRFRRANDLARSSGLYFLHSANGLANERVVDESSKQRA